MRGVKLAALLAVGIAAFTAVAALFLPRARKS